MSAEPSQLFQRYLAPRLKTAGFLKKAGTWWRDYPESVAVLNIQKSQWGPTLYINLGICFRFLGEMKRPPISACHLLIRLDSLAARPLEVSRALDFVAMYGREISDAERLGTIDSAIVEYALPWFDAYSTVDGANAAITDSPPRALQVAPALRSTIPRPARSLNNRFERSREG